MSNYHLIPRLTGKIKYELVDDQVILSMPGRSIRCTKEEAVASALIDECADFEQIAIRMAQLDKFDEVPCIDTFISETFARFEREGIVAINQRESLAYPMDISKYDHIVSTRGGLYAVNRDGHQRLAYGFFYGLCIDNDNNLLAFEYPYYISSLWKLEFSIAKEQNTKEGLIKQFSYSKGRLDKPFVKVSGLSNNCHMLYFHDDAIYAVETEEQIIRKIDPQGKMQDIPTFVKAGYHHINSIARHNNRWLVMQSVTSHNNYASRVGVFDLDWKHIETIKLSGSRAHNICIEKEEVQVSSASENELSFWFCDSLDGELGHYPSGTKVKLKPAFMSDNTTRGLSDHGKYWVVGSGKWGMMKIPAHIYDNETIFHGAISYIDQSSGDCVAQIKLPEAPCGIIKNPCYRSA